MDSLINWWLTLSQETQNDLFIVFATIIFTSIVTTFIPKVVFPLLLKAYLWIREQLYKMVAGFSVFTWWGVGRYKVALRKRIERIVNPWSTQKLFLANVFIPIKVETDYLLPHMMPSSGKKPEELVSLRAAAQEFQRFVLVGDPGAGKSTALKSICLATLDGKLNMGYIPIFIELKQYANSDSPLDKYIVQIFEEYDFPNALNFTDRLLHKGTMLLLLDALDEVGNRNMQKVIEHIRQFCNDYPLNKVVISCRSATYEQQFDDLSSSTVSLTNFNDIQISTFLRRWSYPVGKSSSRLMQILRDRPQILTICRNPLMLTIVVSLYVETNYELPSSRSEFYHTCIEAVLKRWDTLREINRSNRFPYLDKKKVLQKLAGHLMNNEQLDDLEFETLVEFVSSVLPLISINANNAEAIVQEIVQNSGLLMYIGPRKLRFSHLTFQEFFAATNVEEENDPVSSISKAYFNNPKRWREVCLLFCGISHKGNELIKLFLDKQLLMAAYCVADGESISIDTANHVIAKLVEHIHPHNESVDDYIKALSLLAANQKKDWSRLAFSRLIDLLDIPSDQVKRSAIVGLANIPSMEAAHKLVSMLNNTETRTLAKQALIQLGEIALPQIKVLLESNPNSELQKICMEICSQIPQPEVIDILLPILFNSTQINQALAAWFLGSLLQEPGIESALDIAFETLPKEKHFSNMALEPLRTWVWPFNKGEESALPYITSQIVYSLINMPGGPYTIIFEYSKSAELDLRVAVPLCICLYQQLKSNPDNDSKFKQAIGLLLFGDELYWDTYDAHMAHATAIIKLQDQIELERTRTYNHSLSVNLTTNEENDITKLYPYSVNVDQTDKKPTPEKEWLEWCVSKIKSSFSKLKRLNKNISYSSNNPHLNNKIMSVFEHTPYQLQEYWLSVLEQDNRQHYKIDSSRKLAFAISLSLLTLSGINLVLSIFQSTPLHLVSFFIWSYLGVKLSIFWSKRIMQNRLISLLTLPMGWYVYISDLLWQRWNNIHSFVALISSLIFALFCAAGAANSLKQILGEVGGIIGVLVLEIIGVFMFHLNWNIKQQANPWQEILEKIIRKNTPKPLLDGSHIEGVFDATLILGPAPLTPLTRIDRPNYDDVSTQPYMPHQPKR